MISIEKNRNLVISIKNFENRKFPIFIKKSIFWDFLNDFFRNFEISLKMSEFSKFFISIKILEILRFYKKCLRNL